MVKKILLFTALSYINLCVLSAQTHDNHGVDTNWFKGSIILSDGTELAGFVRNNQKGNIISYKKDYSGSNFKSFRADNILSLEYFDLDNNVMRRFYSLATKNKADGTEEVYLFEILREFEHFAVLSILGRSQDYNTDDMMAPVSRAAGLPVISSFVGKTAFLQTEEIYFINEDGERELYMTVQYRDVKADFYKYKTDKGKVDDPLLPSRYIDQKDWIQMETFNKKAYLKIDNKEKLLFFLDHYKTLVD